MISHQKQFNYKYAASKITNVAVADDEAIVSILSEEGEVFITYWTLDAFFEKKPSPGRYLVDGHFGERFVIDEDQLYKLGDEIKDAIG